MHGIGFDGLGQVYLITLQSKLNCALLPFDLT